MLWWSLLAWRAHLEVGAGDTLGQLPEQRFLDLDKLRGVNDVEYLLHLSQVHDLLGAVDLGPELEQSHYNLSVGG